MQRKSERQKTMKVAENKTKSIKEALGKKSNKNKYEAKHDKSRKHRMNFSGS